MMRIPQSITWISEISLIRDTKWGDLLSSNKEREINILKEKDEHNSNYSLTKLNTNLTYRKVTWMLTLHYKIAIKESQGERTIFQKILNLVLILFQESRTTLTVNSILSLNLSLCDETCSEI